MNRPVYSMVGLVLAIACGMAVAAEPTAPPPAAPPGQKISATVKTVEGTVESRPAVGQPWGAVQVGQQLSEGADLRTGFRARCVLDMVDSLVQIDPLTVVRIGELRKQGDTVRTRLVMKHGNTQAAVAKKPTPADFAIVTPTATLSVRGTRTVNCRFFPDTEGQYSLSNSGLLEVADKYFGRRLNLLPGDQTDDNLTLPNILLAWQHLSPVLGGGNGYDRVERWASMRWNTSMPLPPGLGGAGGPPILQVLQTIQQHGGQCEPPSDSDTVIIIIDGSQNPSSPPPRSPRT